MGTYRGIFEAPRFAGLPSAIKDAAFQLGLKVDVLDVDKGIIRETVRFSVSGNADMLLVFKKWVESLETQ